MERNIDLVSKFVECPREYTLTFAVSGANVSIAPITAAYGSVVDLVAVVEAKIPDGYSYSMAINGVDKVSVKITADAVVEIVFTPMETAKSGCGGTISGMAIGLTALCGAALMLLKKREN